jgi:hypothetical protein
MALSQGRVANTPLCRLPLYVTVWCYVWSKPSRRTRYWISISYSATRCAAQNDSVLWLGADFEGLLIGAHAVLLA